mgnify:FL=1
MTRKELTIDDTKIQPSPDPVQARKDKLDRLIALGVEPYPTTWRVTHRAAELQDRYAHLEDGEATEDRVVIAGRITASRNSGMFRDLRDGSGRIQVFTHKEHADETSIALKTLIDLGDFIGVEGYVRRTPAGELTVNAERITLLTKTLRPMPEKHHGVTDSEVRTRNRTLDLIANERSRAVFQARFRAIAEIRKIMAGEDYLEVETPVLHQIYGGASADPFITHYNAVDQDMYLRIALELHLKRTLAGGLADRVYEIGRVFRNEGVSTRHNPEFTMLEAYQAYADYTDMMALTEKLAEGVAVALHGSPEVTFGDHTLNFKGPFPRLSMPQAVKDAAGLDFLAMADAAEARAAVQESFPDLEIEADASWGECLEAAFAESVEPTLVQPTHVTHFPKDISPLAKSDPDDPRLVERFETFCNGWEIANAFSELNDPVEQRARMVEQVEQAHARGEMRRELDEEFLSAIEQGMPPTGGLGVGIDRLIMLMTDTHTIRDVILYPALRAKG